MSSLSPKYTKAIWEFAEVLQTEKQVESGLSSCLEIMGNQAPGRPDLQYTSQPGTLESQRTSLVERTLLKNAIRTVKKSQERSNSCQRESRVK